MRLFGIAVIGGFAVMAVALIIEAASSANFSGWLALVAVVLALLGIVGSGAWWLSHRAAPHDPEQTQFVRWSLAVVAAAAVAAIALVLQAAFGGAGWAWLAIVAVAALAVSSLVARALFVAS